MRRHPLAQMLGIGLIASVIGVVLSLQVDWFPKQGAGSSHEIDTLYDVLLVASVPVFVLVMTVAIYSVVKFRARPGDMGDGVPIHGNTRLEVVWVTIPFLLVTSLAVYGWVVLRDVEAKKPNEMVVDVKAQQFTWHFSYPGEGKVASNELILPEGRPVKFNITSEDVIHSFWVPEFRLKSDAVPGLTTHVRLTPKGTGNYSVVCAELCGIGHSTMRVPVHVVPPRQFTAWVQRQKGGGQAQAGGRAQAGGGTQTQAGGGAAGKALFDGNGCGGCHTLAADGSTATLGPNLDNLAADAAKFGKQLNESPAEYVKQSIVDPRAFTVKGFPKDLMPKDFGQKLRPAEIDALVKYLLSSGGK